MRGFVLGRALACLVMVLALAGCQYGPLDLEDNEPEIGDARVDREFTVTGTSFLQYREIVNNQIGDVLCVSEQDVVGYEAPELNTADCVGCRRAYRLGLFEREIPTCEFGRASIDIAFAPLEYLDQVSTDQPFADFLADGDAREFVYNTYTTGDPGWFPRMGAFEDESPYGPFGGVWECDADWCLQQYRNSREGDVTAYWWLALDFDE